MALNQYERVRDTRELSPLEVRSVLRELLRKLDFIVVEEATPDYKSLSLQPSSYMDK